jgi:VTC domain
VKTRGRRGTTVKERLLVDSGVARRAREEPTLGLPAEARRFVAERLDAAMVTDVDVDALGPVLHTAYRRSTLLLPSSHTRLTIDRDLCWSAPDGSRAHAGELVVVETKTPSGAAPELDHGLWSLGIRPVRISKYGAGLALLDPALPSNRWHRVIKRHLAPAPLATPVPVPASQGAHHA